MIHLPTDEQVHGKYQGYYTRKEKAQMREQLISQLFLLLDTVVTRLWFNCLPNNLSKS